MNPLRHDIGTTIPARLGGGDPAVSFGSGLAS